MVWDKKDLAPTSMLVTTGKLKLPKSKLSRSTLELLELSQRDDLFNLATLLGIDLLALLDRAKDGKLTRTELQESGLFQSLKKKGGYNPISPEKKIKLDSLLSILRSPKLVDKPIEIPGAKFNLFQRNDGGFYSEQIKLPSGEVISEGIQFNYSGIVVAVVGGELKDTQGTISHPEKIKFRKEDKLYQIVRRDRNLFAVEVQENSDARAKVILPKQVQVTDTELDNRTVTRVEREVSWSSDRAMHLTIQSELAEANPEKVSRINSRKAVIQDIGRYHSGLTSSIFGFESVEEDKYRSYVHGVRILERATGGRATEILTSNEPALLLLNEQQFTNQELENEKVLRKDGVATNKAINRTVESARASHEFEFHIDPFLASGPHEAAHKTPFRVPKGVGILTHLEYAPSPDSGRLKSLRFISHNDLNFNIQNLRLEYERMFGPGIGITLNKTRDGFAEVVIAWPESFLRSEKRIKGTLISGEISNFLPFEFTANIGVVWGDRLERDFENKCRKAGFPSLAENISTIKKLAPESLHQYLFTGEVSSYEVRENLQPLPGLSPVLGENIRAVIAKETRDIIRSMTTNSLDPKAEIELYASLLKEHLSGAFKQLALLSKHRGGALVGIHGGLTWHGPGWIIEPILTIKDQVVEQLELSRQKVGSSVSKLQEASLVSRDGRLILDLSPNKSSSIVINAGLGIAVKQISKDEFQVMGSVAKVKESVDILPSGRKKLSLSLMGKEEETEIAYRRVSRENLSDLEALPKRKESVQADVVSSSLILSPQIESEIFFISPTPTRYFRRHLYSTPIQWLIGKLTRKKPHSHFISNESSSYN